FDCIQCGLCALRCPSEIVQYHVGQLGRRMYGKYGIEKEENVENMVKKSKAGKFEKDFKKLSALKPDDLKKEYTEQQKTREVY
ncbi:MAG: 4Fe-4S ferredoxin, partial [Actinomycetia bacterium]|nr:4Fe-4S ferredoxin [Actinomycetes bacterium]